MLALDYVRGGMPLMSQLISSSPITTRPSIKRCSSKTVLTPMFISSLDEIVKSIQTLSRTEAPVSESTLHAEKLLRTGVESLSDMFAGWVRDSTGPPLTDPVHQTADPPQPLGFSPNTINKLHKLYAYLQQLSKSLPSNQTIQDVHKEIVSAYASVRSKSNMKRFYLSSKVLARSKSTRSTETGQSVNSVIKRSLSSYIGVAFNTYAAILEQLPRFDEEVRRPAGRKENELGDLLHAFKGSCLRSLPEFIADTKTFWEKQPVGSEASNTMTSEMTIVAVEYLKMFSVMENGSLERRIIPRLPLVLARLTMKHRS
ncbi:hypothetical protein PGT21_000928 [Puccinia graminis f. sp. tritici]|uniref:Uncharacterized protein n=1 Tax=Puccinia graminis f. sp. tritici TaxID=56615 RepID=A0A5B0P881_PUCGR|nr:hypothetical protein PGT21_000928 [Puccinia graminis f. sp. tritici]